MKKLICLLLAITAYVSAIPNISAEKDSKIFINDNEFAGRLISDEENITLIPLRAFAETMGWSVEWIEERRDVYISNELLRARFTVGSEYYSVNQDSKEMDTPVQIIDGSTYIPLNITEEAFLCNLECSSDNVYITAYESGNYDSLIKYGIINKDDASKGEYISVSEAIDILGRLSGSTAQDYYLKDWYGIKNTEHLDYLPDDQKKLIMSLRNIILSTEDIVSLKPDSNLTYFQTLKYLIRLTGSTGCIYPVGEFSYTDNEVYDAAAERHLTDVTNTDNVDAPILRKDFYELLNRSLFIEFSRGGGGGERKYMLIDRLVKKEHNIDIQNPEESKTVIPPKEVKADVKYNDDMSISWTLPNEISETDTERISTHINLYTADGENMYLLSGGFITQLDAQDIVQMMVKNNPQKIERIKCIYNKYNSEQEWYCDIALPDITITEEGSAPNPGVYTRPSRKWLPISITLAEGTFKKDAYYILVSYEHKYRKEMYNSISHAIFTVPENTSTFTNPANNTLGVGGINLEDIHIQEVTVTGNTFSGFVLHITPQSDNSFKVIEKTVADE